ncbi:MAG: hypothetical protein QXD36_07275, partial [Sulfolobales archaeon]
LRRTSEDLYEVEKVSSQTMYRYLKLAEYTSLPLAITIFLYLVSGYGMISTTPSLLGFNYVTSSKIHTLPLLRYLTTLLIATHVFTGGTIIINRNLREYPKLRKVAQILNSLYTLVLVMMATLSEIELVFRP